MILSYKGWRNCFLFCLGLFIVTAFWMKWWEARFYSQGELFTIIGLEISYTAEREMDIIYHQDPAIQMLLKAHLYLDYVFMDGAYGGIACLCMMARFKAKKALLRNSLLVLACLQLVAWGCDIRENGFLLYWLSEKPDIRSSFTLYHMYVIIKWSLALTGVLLSIPVLLWKRNG